MTKYLRVVSAAFLPAVATVSLVGLGSGGSFAAEKAPSTCSPNGTALAITANDNKFDKDCLAAPSNQASTIAFDNQDRGLPHNVSIYDKDHGDKALYTGEITYGPNKTTYAVPAIPAGNYQFRCDPHADFMFGNFIVQ
jgi:plastocyanin